MTAPRASAGPGRWLAIAASAVVVAAVVAAIVVMGSPSAQREIKLDQRRIGDLARIVNAVDGHAKQHDGALPPDLATLAREPGRRLPTTDPKDGSPYVYERSGALTYRLCATFATDTARTTDDAGYWGPEEWHHGAGRQCFERKAKGDKDD